VIFAAFVDGKDDVVKTQFSSTLGALLGAVGIFVCGCGEKEEGSPSQQAQEGTADMMDAIVVTVEGESLTEATAMDMAREQATRQGIPPQMIDSFLEQSGSQLREQAREQFIDEVLLKKEAESRGIEVTEEKIDEVIESLNDRLPPGVSLDQAVEAQGMTVAGLRADIAEQQRIQHIYQEQTAGVKEPTEGEIATFYEENVSSFKTEDYATARHILIGCTEDASPEEHASAQAEAEAVRQRLVAGADFAEVAREKSTCPSKERGGDLGSFARGRMVSEFEEAAFSQEIGVVGPVVKTRFGYHIIEVTDRQPGATQSLDQVQAQIRDHLTSQARNDAFMTYVRGLREGASITYPETE
jgi:peptidyl-prolyl cis-trans isomerase C